MSDPVFSFRNTWFKASVAVTATMAVAAAALGLIGLPMLQPDARFAGVWDAICSAAGVIRSRPSSQAPIEPAHKLTQVIVTPDMLAGPDPVSIGRGATLALRCTMCHGVRGLSQADSPNLSGQYPIATYKELRDFKSGARRNAVMEPLVADLSDQDMRDLAAYYAYLPKVPARHPAAVQPPRIVVDGAPLRGIAPCGSCHGGLDNKAGSAWLEGQPAAYIRAQLEAFASGARRNDISEQMRNVARRMKPEEIDAAARYYASRR
jgi:cytochrome c553